MNKSLKIVIGSLITIIVIWGIVFEIDYYKVSNFKMPIFVIPKEYNNHITTYYGLGYKVEVERQSNINGKEIDGTIITKIEMYMFNKFITGAVADISETTKIQTEIDYKTKIEDLPKEYSLINAIKDNCVISLHGKKIFNKDKLDRFLENVENNNADFMRYISYTIEGDMIITDVNFEGSNSFRVTIDSTRDKWASEADRTYQYGRFTKLEKQENGEEISIILSNPIGEDIEKVVTTRYDKDAEIINNYETNFILEINKSKEKKVKKITQDELDNKYDYDIYYYGLESVNIEINDEKIDLKEALLTDKITMEKIIEQAEKDSKIKIIGSDMYKDGGTMIYFYGTYTIIKSYSLDGNKDVYIGIPEMTLNMVR